MFAAYLTVLYVYPIIPKQHFMISTQTNIQPIFQADIVQAYNTINLVAALQLELAVLQAKVTMYYHDEIALRGDKIMMREYCRYFSIEATKSDFL